MVPTYHIVLMGSERGHVWDAYVKHLEQRHGIVPIACCLPSVSSLAFDEVIFMVWETGHGPPSSVLANLVHTSHAVIVATRLQHEQRQLEHQWGKHPNTYCDEDADKPSIPVLFARALKRAATL